MKRYLAFGGECEVERNLGDYIGDFDDLSIAKLAVDVTDVYGNPLHVQGCVLDTKEGRVREWCCVEDLWGQSRRI